MNKRKIRCIWHLNKNCNYNCSYCFDNNLKNKNDKIGHEVKTVVEAFKKNDINWKEIHISGGEPFIYPNFIELCKKITDFSKIIIVTNLSTSNIYKFADEIDSDKVIEIICSIHMEQIPNGNFYDKIEKILYLRKMGFHVFVSQVIYPEILNEYKQMFEYFKDKGNILITPKVMEGIWHKKEYPQGYTEKERKVILKYAEKSMAQQSKGNIYKYGTMVYGRLNWKDRKCSAGYSSVLVEYDGGTYRCHGDRRYLGNLYRCDIKLDDKPSNCTKDLCDCALEGWYGHKSNKIHQKSRVK